MVMLVAGMVIYECHLHMVGFRLACVLFNRAIKYAILIVNQICYFNRLIKYAILIG